MSLVALRDGEAKHKAGADLRVVPRASGKRQVPLEKHYLVSKHS
jgi:hypothetical protein